MPEHYPNINEVIAAGESMNKEIPQGIALLMQKRFAGAKDQYATENIHTDGRIINACMYKSSLDDAEEEIIDAIFNICVHVLKGHYDSYTYTVLSTLINSWNALNSARHYAGGKY